MKERPEMKWRAWQTQDCCWKYFTMQDLIEGKALASRPLCLTHWSQFVFQQDRTGKDCYAGDIVKCYDWGQSADLLCTSEVVWCTDEDHWDLKPDPTDGDRYDLWRNFEIIGNIYQTCCDKGQPGQHGRIK